MEKLKQELQTLTERMAALRRTVETERQLLELLDEQSRLIRVQTELITKNN